MTSPISFFSTDEQLWFSFLIKPPISSWKDQNKQYALEVSQTIINHTLEILYNTSYQRKVIDFLSSKQFSKMRFPDSKDSILKERVALILKETGLFQFSEDSEDIFALSFRSERWTFFNYLLELCPCERFPNHKLRLFMACAHDDIDFIKSHLSQNKGEYLTKTNWNISLLHIACGVGALDIVKFLVEEAAYDIEEKREDGYTPLLIAAMTGQATTVEYLLNKDADLESRTKYGETPLFLAVSEGHREIVKVLIEKGANVDLGDKYDRAIIETAIKKGHVDIVKMIIVSFPHLIESDDFFPHRPALFHAVNHGQLEVTKILLEAGADVNKESSGGSYLHNACAGGHLEIAFELIKKGADLLREDTIKKTPIQRLKKEAWDSLIPLIIEESASLENQAVHLKETLSYLSEKSEENGVLSLETIDQDLKRSRNLQKVLSSLKIILEEYEGKMDIKSANLALKNAQKILTPLLGSLLQLKNKLKAEQVETHFGNQSLPIIDIEKAVMGLGLLVSGQDRDKLINSGLLSERDLNAIGIDQTQIEKINSLLDDLSVSLINKLKQRCEERDALKKSAIAVLDLVAHLEITIFEETRSLCDELVLKMDRLFDSELFYKNWSIGDLNPLKVKLQEFKEKIEALSLSASEAELSSLFSQQQALLKRLLTIERSRLFLMLKHYLSQPRLIEIFESLKTSEKITSLSEFRKIMAPKFSDEISLTKFLYHLIELFLSP